jgi:Na+-translocating ferredoxin:NAD+ oxidoreductase RnfD subunit
MKADTQIESPVNKRNKAWSISKWTDRNFKYAPQLLITTILIVGHLSFGILNSYWTILSAIGAAVLTELVLARIFLGKFKSLNSAYISGISVGILIRSTMVWPYILTSVISIMTKYIFRYKGSHLFNPSNFGVSWMLFTATWAVAGLSVQWGNELLPMAVIWTMGLVIVWRAKRLHVTLTYVFSFIFFAFLRSQLLGEQFFTELSPLTGPMYQLFIFFMITDPPTNVKSKKGQILVAFLVALVEFFLRMNEFIYAPFYALFLVGPAAKFIDLKWFSGRAQEVSPKTEATLSS